MSCLLVPGLLPGGKGSGQPPSTLVLTVTFASMKARLVSLTICLHEWVPAALPFAILTQGHILEMVPGWYIGPPVNFIKGLHINFIIYKNCTVFYNMTVMVIKF